MTIKTYITLLYLLLSGCDYVDKISTDFSQNRKSIVLNNNLGEIDFFIPSSFDTLLIWENRSDCAPCCDSFSYRWANSKFSLVKESGFFQNELTDSLFQFTITHKKDLNCLSAIEIDKETLLELTSIIESSYQEAFSDNLLWQIREIRNINNQLFIVYGYSGKSSIGTEQYAILKAITKINNEDVHFTYECEASNCQRFIDSMIESMNSIKILKK